MKYLKLCLIIVLYASWVKFSQAAIVFQDDFNSTPDWQSKQLNNGQNGIGWDMSPTYTGACTTYCPPQNWTAYRASQSWWLPNLRDTFLISSEGARGAGKGITYNVESTGVYGDWSGGGIDKYLGPAGYPELFVRLWIKETPEFCWASSNLNLNAMGKLMRITSLRRNPTIDYRLFNPEQYPSPDTSPTLIVNAYHRFQPNYQIPSQFNLEERYAPNYEEGTGSTWGPNPDFGASNLGVVFPTDIATGGQGYCGDNQWHSYEVYVKMNSALGVADGVYKVWLDGQLAASKNTIPWIKPGTDTNGTVMNMDTGWNWIMINDNIDSTAYARADKVEMSRYVDDVVMYTPMVGTEPECGGSCTDGRLPLSYVQSGSDSTAPAAPTTLTVL